MTKIIRFSLFILSIGINLSFLQAASSSNWKSLYNGREAKFTQTTIARIKLVLNAHGIEYKENNNEILIPKALRSRVKSLIKAAYTLKRFAKTAKPKE